MNAREPNPWNPGTTTVVTPELRAEELRAQRARLRVNPNDGAVILGGQRFGRTLEQVEAELREVEAVLAEEARQQAEVEAARARERRERADAARAQLPQVMQQATAARARWDAALALLDERLERLFGDLPSAHRDFHDAGRQFETALRDIVPEIATTGGEVRLNAVLAELGDGADDARRAMTGAGSLPRAPSPELRYASVIALLLGALLPDPAGRHKLGVG
jgi:hypothetical protein